MFDKLKKMFGNKANTEDFKAPLKGKLVAVQDVPDPTFAEEMLGPGFAIIPTEGKLYAPTAGSVTLVFDTLHAIAITTEAGAEVIFHVGLDTVKENGAGFTAHVAVGDQVKEGDLLLTFDLDALKAKGYNLITPVVVTNKASFSNFAIATDKLNQNVSPADVVYTVTLA